MPSRRGAAGAHRPWKQPSAPALTHHGRRQLWNHGPAQCSGGQAVCAGRLVHNYTRSAPLQHCYGGTWTHTCAMAGTGSGSGRSWPSVMQPKIQPLMQRHACSHVNGHFVALAHSLAVQVAANLQANRCWKGRAMGDVLFLHCTWGQHMLLIAFPTCPVMSSISLYVTVRSWPGSLPSLHGHGMAGSCLLRGAHSRAGRWEQTRRTDWGRWPVESTAGHALPALLSVFI